MNTSRLVACFQHKIPTGPHIMTFAPRLQEEGHYQLTVAVSSHQIQGSPFQWQVIAPAKVLLPAVEYCQQYGTGRVPLRHLRNLTRAEGVLSWKVKKINPNSMYRQSTKVAVKRKSIVELGVAASSKIGRWTFSSSGHRCAPDEFDDEPSNIQSCQDGDVFALFLNMDTKKLIIQNLRTSETELFEGIKGIVSPYLNPVDSNVFTLDV